MDVQDLANEAASYFEKATREDGSEYWRVQNDAPEWVRSLVYAAHDNGELLPDDHRYRFTIEALWNIVGDGKDAEPPEADIYTSDLLTWIASNLNRQAYADEIIQEYGSLIQNFNALLTLAQQLEKDEVFDIVLDFLREKADE